MGQGERERKGRDRKGRGEKRREGEGGKRKGKRESRGGGNCCCPMQVHTAFAVYGSAIGLQAYRPGMSYMPKTCPVCRPISNFRLSHLGLASRTYNSCAIQESPADARVSARQCRHIVNAFKVRQRTFPIKSNLQQVKVIQGHQLWCQSKARATSYQSLVVTYRSIVSCTLFEILTHSQGLESQLVFPTPPLFDAPAQGEPVRISG